MLLAQMPGVRTNWGSQATRTATLDRSALLLVVVLLLVAHGTSTVRSATPPAGSQATALDWRGPALEATASAIDEVIREGDPWELLDWTLTIRPSLLYRQYLEGNPDIVVNPRVSAILQVRFGEKPLDAVRRAIKLERALAAHDQALRRGICDALLAHADLLLAQQAHATALAAVETAVFTDGAASPAQDLALRQAEHALTEARVTAASLGLPADAHYEPLRFVVPGPPDVTELSAWRVQQLRVAEAEARAMQAGGASMLRDFRLGTAWRNRAIDLDLEAGLLAGRPGFRFGAVQPGGRERFEVRLSAEIVFSDDLADAPQLRQAVLAEREELAALAERLLAQEISTRIEAGFAEEELALAEADLAEALAAHLELVVLFNTATLPGNTEPLSERELTRLEADLARAEREVARLQTRVYRAWITYVRRTFDHLEAAGAAWEWRRAAPPRRRKPAGPGRAGRPPVAVSP